MAQQTNRHQELLKRSDELYSRYGAALELKHDGEFIAISPAGDTIHGLDRFFVLEEATKRFGQNSFVFRKIGSGTLGKWRMGVAR